MQLEALLVKIVLTQNVGMELMLHQFCMLQLCIIVHKYIYYTLLQNTNFLLDDKRVLIINETSLSTCRSTILRYC